MIDCLWYEKHNLNNIVASELTKTMQEFESFYALIEQPDDGSINKLIKPSQIIEILPNQLN